MNVNILCSVFSLYLSTSHSHYHDAFNDLQLNYSYTAFCFHAEMFISNWKRYKSDSIDQNTPVLPLSYLVLDSRASSLSVFFSRPSHRERERESNKDTHCSPSVSGSHCPVLMENDDNMFKHSRCFKPWFSGACTAQGFFFPSDGNVITQQAHPWLI